MANGVVNQEQIERTLDFWGKRSARKLTNEDARQINLNMTRFFDILAEWDVRDHKPLQRMILTPQSRQVGFRFGQSISSELAL